VGERLRCRRIDLDRLLGRRPRQTQELARPYDRLGAIGAGEQAVVPDAMEALGQYVVDAAYPAHTAIKLILDNHAAHISRETRTWLATRPAGRFEFTFTPKHGSWLNLVEGFFSKFARSVLRHIRVTSKQELKERIMAGIEDINRYPVIHTWSYKLAEAA
jgi:hypothetical protein